MTVLTYQSEVADSRDRFGQTVRAEWTKLRTMRGWLIGLLLAAVLPAGFAFLGRSSCASQTSGPNGRTVTTACPGPAIGPNGEAVQDAFFFVHQPLTGNGSLTVRLTSLTGLYPRAGYDTAFWVRPSAADQENCRLKVEIRSLSRVPAWVGRSKIFVQLVTGHTPGR